MTASRNRGALPTVWIVLIFALVIILCFAVSRSFGEEKKVYQAGTIVEVKVHQSAGSSSPNSRSDFAIQQPARENARASAARVIIVKRALRQHRIEERGARADLLVRLIILESIR